MKNFLKGNLIIFTLEMISFGKIQIFQNHSKPGFASHWWNCHS
ncbi:hypothetical protein Li1_1468 [Lactococcus lactis subsp. lactis]|nr:hypothetical protein KF134_1865 [Lactococcus lactis subsp. lactis]KSU00457.1 hypothetical protein KF196_0096 [Lactococcus lactis subsp. lactis]KSU05417.1 hypothetical protein Li1_1468 [Lactococcus lactis subsp. lactis]